MTRAEAIAEKVKAFWDATRAGLDPPEQAVVAKPSSALVSLPCVYRGEATGETVGCKTCRGSVKVKLFACSVHETCTLGKRVTGHGCCDSRCAERKES